MGEQQKAKKNFRVKATQVRAIPFINRQIAEPDVRGNVWWSIRDDNGIILGELSGEFFEELFEEIPSVDGLESEK